MPLLHVPRREVRAWMWDDVVAASMVAVALIALVTRIDVEDVDLHRFRPETWWSWAITIAVCASVVGRRRWPLRALGIGLALMLALELAHRRDSVAFFALLIGVYSVAAHLPLRLAGRGLAMTVALYAVLAATGRTILVAAPGTGVLLFATAFALGLMIRRGRAHQDRAVDAAIARAAELAEIADLEAADERLRLAQELHDVVAHSLSVIAVQAGIGVHLIERQPAEAGRALDAIRTTSRSALSELTRLVDVLRDGGPAVDAHAPALEDLAVLVEQLRGTGLPITFTADGDLGGVPAAVSLAAYRIVQEALTNVVRHAGRARVGVSVRVTDELVDLTVDDDGHGTTSPLDPGLRDGGHGLVGMSERARMYGGEVRSGPRPGGGFRVQATLRCVAAPIPNPLSVEPAADVPGTGSVAPSQPWVRPWMWDLVLAAVIAALATVQVLTTHLSATGPHYASSGPAAWLLRIGSCLPLVVRRRYPTIALSASWVMCIALMVGNYEMGLLIFVLWIGLYSVAGHPPRRRLLGALIGSYVCIAILVWSRPPDLTVAGAVWVGFLFTAVAVAGYVVRRDRERRAAELAERETAADAQSRRARLAITSERLRIADELSTIITLSMRTIAQEANTGSRMVDLDPAAARDTLQAISETSREALSDLRCLLKHMRNTDEPVLHSPVTLTSETLVTGAAR